MLLVGLTGGIGVGKSTVASMFAARGAAVVLMHTRGRPDVMASRAQYADVVAEITARMELAGTAAGAEGSAQ